MQRCADIFNYDPTAGFEYQAAPTTATMKSLSSGNSTQRSNVLKCITNHAYPTGFTTCNPDSQGVGTGLAWDLSSWQQAGLLSGTLGWNSYNASNPTSGAGLKSLGTAVGQASLVYQFMVQRVINHICPLGNVSQTSQNNIAAMAQQNDSFATIVANVAADPSCR